MSPPAPLYLSADGGPPPIDAPGRRHRTDRACPAGAFGQGHNPVAVVGAGHRLVNRRSPGPRQWARPLGTRGIRPVPGPTLLKPGVPLVLEKGALTG
jgi:hypothetical protein